MPDPLWEVGSAITCRAATDRCHGGLRAAPLRFDESPRICRRGYMRGAQKGVGNIAQIDGDRGISPESNPASSRGLLDSNAVRVAQNGSCTKSFCRNLGFAPKRCSTRAGERRLPCQIDSWGGGAEARIYGIYE